MSVCTKHAFELIHTDIKSIPTDSYHKYKYLIIFLDDFTSMALTIPLRMKSAALTATHQFLQIVKMQFQVSVQGWMSDFGGEYKSAAYNNLLKGEGIRVYNSAPHIPQQNRCAERFTYICALWWTKLRICTIWPACSIAGGNLQLPMPPISTIQHPCPTFNGIHHTKHFIASSLESTTWMYLIVQHMSSFQLIFGLISSPLSQNLWYTWMWPLAMMHFLKQPKWSQRQLGL